jgi:response regulator RpfG family c-di-GMP phosphodiesterase
MRSARQSDGAMDDRQHTILLIEEHADTREALTMFLRMEGYTVHAVDRPTDAAELLANDGVCLAVVNVGSRSVTDDEHMRRLHEAAMQSGIPLALVVSTRSAADAATALGVPVLFAPLDPAKVSALVASRSGREAAR